MQWTKTATALLCRRWSDQMKENKKNKGHGKVILFPDYDEVELTRPITDSELKTDRFKGYCKGDNTNAYNTWKDVILAGK